MTEQEFKSKVAANITKYRKHSGLTQLSLAEKLNYSDKAVSKWERGESLPDAFMLYTLAELFGVTLNDLADENERRTVDYTPDKQKKHSLITSMAVGLVWLVASIGFLVLKIIGITIFNPTLLFLYAIPVSFIVALVFTCIWWKIPSRAVCVSGLIWSLAVSIFLTFAVENVSYLFISAAILQVLTVLWFVFMAHLKKQHK